MIPMDLDYLKYLYGEQQMGKGGVNQKFSLLKHVACTMFIRKNVII